MINTSVSGINLVQEVQKITGGAGSSITIDTTGVLPVIESGLELTGSRGQMILVGVPKADAELEINLAGYLGVRLEMIFFCSQ